MALIRDKKELLSLNNIIELCMAALLFYNFWYIRIMGENAMIHWVFFLGLAGFLVLKKNIKNIITYDNGPCLWYWIFTVATALTGFLVSVNMTNNKNAVVDNLEYAILFSAIISLSKEKKSYQWILKIMSVVILICGITAVLNVNTHNGRMILGATGNSNDLGIKMVYGICCILLMDKAEKKVLSAVKVVSVLIMMYVIVQTASRKALIIAAAVLAAWAIFVLPKILSKSYKGLTVFVYIAIIAVIGYGVYAYLPQFYGTKSFTRLQYTSEGVDMRWDLYKEAFQVFKQHPLIGVGLNNYMFYSASKLYSHSTIAETLADTGILGSIIWIGFIVNYIKDFIKLIGLPFARRDEKFWIDLICFGGSIVFSVVIILYFDLASMIFLAITAAVLEDLKSTNLKRRVERKYR